MQTHDMSTIIYPINLLVSDEYDRASKLHGKYFQTWHDGYGVIAEEVQEAIECAVKVSKIMSVMLKTIRMDKGEDLIDCADAIQDAAVACSAEMVQVAAMCKKMVLTVREGKDEAAV